MNRIEHKFFKKSNIKLISGLVILLGFTVLNGFIGIISMNLSYERTMHYYESVNKAKDIHSDFLMQINAWNNIIRCKTGTEEYRALYYSLSKFSSSIQDNLFNLKSMMKNNNFTSQEIGEIIRIHKKLSDDYILLLIKIENNEINPSDNPQEIMKESENKAFVNLDKVVTEIQSLSESEMDKVNKYYILMVQISLGFMTSLSVIMIFLIISANNKTQKTVLSISNTLNRYLPRQLVTSIINNEIQTKEAINKRYLTICFTDMQGFTALSEKIDAETTSKMLNEYLTEMTAIVQDWNGMIDKFVGDGIMILFGAFGEISKEEHALNCIRMSISMQKKMEELRKKWIDEGLGVTLRLRIGVNSGIVTLGSFGPVDRMTFTAIGPAVNIASRLEGICPVDGVLMSQETKSLVQGKILTRYRGHQAVKGIEIPVPTYEALF